MSFERLAKVKWVIAAIACPLFIAVAHAEFTREAPGGWVISDVNDKACAMLNDFDAEGQNTTTLFFRKDIYGETIISVSNSSWTLVKGRSYEITYKLNGSLYGGPSTAIEGGFGTVTNAEFERDLAIGDGLYMTLDDKVVDHLSLRGSGQALKYLNQCVSIKKRQFDAAEREKAEFAYINTNPFAEAKPLPLPAARAANPINRGTWVSASDYPSRSLQLEQKGTVRYKVTVGINGRVEGCEVVSSSGFADLDAATCSTLTRRARFEPATDTDGSPTRGYYEDNVNWNIP